MLSEQLLADLHKLNRSEKLRVVRILVNELAAEEELLNLIAGEHEVWSPYDAFEAANTLQMMLEEDKKQTRDRS